MCVVSAIVCVVVYVCCECNTVLWVQYCVVGAILCVVVYVCWECDTVCCGVCVLWV